MPFHDLAKSGIPAQSEDDNNDNKNDEFFFRGSGFRQKIVFHDLAGPFFDILKEAGKIKNHRFSYLDRENGVIGQGSDISQVLQG
ncbi:MAG: hypothetical protein R2861_05565 [Desulfobacterales bacterium]